MDKLKTDEPWLFNEGNFYACSASLVGGNGTVWSSSNTGYAYMRIDAAGTPGYLTAAD